MEAEKKSCVENSFNIGPVHKFMFIILTFVYRICFFSLMKKIRIVFETG
jgi:hypothetical protein